MNIYIVNRYEADKKQTHTVKAFTSLELANAYVDCTVTVCKEYAINKKCFMCVQLKGNEHRNKATLDDDEMWIEKVPYIE